MSSDAEGRSSRRASRSTSRPETPAITPPVTVAGSSATATEDLFSAGFVRRQTQPKASVDLRQVDYVSHVDSNLICLICHNAFVNPRQIGACQHVFCKDCLSQAFSCQSQAQKTCPTCRTPVPTDEPPTEVQRLVTRMLDELVIECPNKHLGCGWSDKRTDVQDHVELYCDFTMVDCPDKNCRFEVQQKDFHRGCLHATVNCPDCHTSMMKRDLENHTQKECLQRHINCEHCQQEFTRFDMPCHIRDACPKFVIACSGHTVGCNFKDERTVAAQHISQCPMAKMAPYFAAQDAQLETQIAANKILHRKIDMLEGIIGTGTVPPPQPAESANNINTALSNALTLDASTHHLLTLYEGVNSEVDRLTSGLAELDGRLTMTMLNEQGRTREDILHLNHAVGAMRMQLQWLISARLQAQRAVGTGPVAAAAAAASSSTAGGGSGLQPLRRLSDPNRQDPKL